MIIAARRSTASYSVNPTAHNVGRFVAATHRLESRTVADSDIAGGASNFAQLYPALFASTAERTRFATTGRAAWSAGAAAFALLVAAIVR